MAAPQFYHLVTMVEVTIADGTRCRIRDPRIDDLRLSLNRGLSPHFERKLSDRCLLLADFVLGVNDLILLDCLPANRAGGAATSLTHPVFKTCLMEKVLRRASKLLNLIIVLKLTQANNTLVNLEGRSNDVVLNHHLSDCCK